MEKSYIKVRTFCEIKQPNNNKEKIGNRMKEKDRRELDINYS